MNNISVASLKAKIANGEKVNLLDVREPDERAVFNIGGVFIPLGDILTMRTEEIDDLKNEEIICYCRSGKRSLQAAMVLESMGFTNLSNLEGGMIAWQSEG
jgi:rhodanese-related sulfurtransferase